ncbi:MAG: hypothetical protein R3178_03115 [Rhodothermales bacterium]|nr:hypothetical protein [Rhodothermales bacterium]
MSVERPASRVPVRSSVPLRIALYSHDTCGLGHFRRNLLIARALRASLNANVLLVSGIREAGSFPVEEGIDTLHLPALAKAGNLKYRPRRLDIGLERLVRLRSDAVFAALMAFRPDAFVVDNVPLGAVGELERSLRSLRSEGRTYTVLGMRDVLDTPQNVHREWLRPDNAAAIRDLYDSVWIYGDPDVFDVVREYDFPGDISRKTRFTGYLNPLAMVRERERTGVRGDEHPEVCLVGGGHAGAKLASTFADACTISGCQGLVLTGPFMDAESADRLAHHPNVSVRRFEADPIPLYRSARSVVSMGGYNTTLELLALGKHALIVPRVRPREEQLVRAEALNRRGLVDLLHPEKMTSDRIAAWLAADRTHHVTTRPSINMNGLASIVSDLSQLAGPHRSHTALAG